MLRILLYITGFIFVLVFTALFEPPIMAKFQYWGWHENPQKIPGDVLNWMAAIVGEITFPWVAGGGLGLAAGVWLNFMASNYDKKISLKQQNSQEVGKRCAIMAIRIRNEVPNKSIPEVFA